MSISVLLWLAGLSATAMLAWLTVPSAFNLLRLRSSIRQYEQLYLQAAREPGHVLVPILGVAIPDMRKHWNSAARSLLTLRFKQLVEHLEGIQFNIRWSRQRFEDATSPWRGL